ncbi:MAG: helix-turn-helix domain-containing protein [Clostridiaceae bacterium]|nr:helix-turn-helix domain-containing protein [Clostridiaceae bacterium]
MYSVMIVEDELLVRMGLCTSIPWDSLDMQVIAAENNGASAWETFCVKKPDIVLTDLRMPGIDGTKLIRRIRESDSTCEIIVITCLEEFEILYQLMQMHITGYLLKATMSQEDILNLLRQAKKNLAEEKHSSIQNDAPSMENELLKNLLLDHHDLERYHQECLRMNQIPMAIRTVFMMSLDLTSPEPILVPTLQKLFLDKLSTYGACVGFSNDNHLVYALPEAIDLSSSDMSASLLELARYSSDILGVKPRMTLFTIDPDGKNINSLWEQGKKILREAFFYPDSLTVLNGDSLSIPKKLLKKINIFQEQVQLIPWKSPKHKELFFTRLQDLRRSLENKSAFLQVAAELVYLYSFSFLAEHMPEPADFDIDLANAKSAEAVIQLLSEKLLPAQMNSHSIYEKKMYETMRYVWEHAGEAINLASLADMVALSPNYYATLFKQTAGCSFSEYVGHVRMEKACTLLSNKELSIKEIASRCGYSDMTYFIRFFKQKIGVPPHRWRRGV